MATITALNKRLMISFFLRRKSLLFLLFLCSCTSGHTPWNYDATVTRDSRFNSSRLLLPADELTLSPGLEFIRTAAGRHLYLYTKGKAFPENGQATLIIGEKATPFTGELFAGGQRMLIPDEISYQLTDALIAGQSCNLKVGYQTVCISSDNFSKMWKTFVAKKISKTDSRIKLSCLMTNR